MKVIKISSKKHGDKDVFVDDDDYDYLIQFKWYIHKEGKSNIFYAKRNVKREKGVRRKGGILMHRDILKVTNPLELCDHKNRNGLDNQKVNLRKADSTQNCANRSKKIGATSIYIGVSWNKVRSKWVAKIAENKKTKYIGAFELEKEAAEAYDERAKKHFGEFANLNFK